jgi:hypothetical protein
MRKASMLSASATTVSELEHGLMGRSGMIEKS